MATGTQYTDRELADHLDIETGEMICNRDEIQGKDNRIRNLRSLLARERLFRRQWQEEARRNYYRLLPNA